MSVVLSLDGENRRRVNDNVRFITGTGVPTDGSTGANICGPSSLYFDITNSIVYINIGTKASPTWTSITAAIAANAITTAMLQNLAVTTAKLSLLAVGTGQLADGSVTTIKLADLNVTTSKIALLAITTALLNDLSVTTAKIAALAVDSSKLATNSVINGKIANSLLTQFSGTIISADITGTGVGQFGNANGYPIIPAQGVHTVIELISVIMIYDFITAAYGAGGNITVNRAAGAGALTGLISAANSVGAAVDKIVQFMPLTTAGFNLTENEGVNLVSAAAFTQPGTAAGVIRYVSTCRIHATGL